jgi:hypothetical protein
MAGEKGNSLSQLYLEGLFQAVFTAISNIFANGASPLTNLYVSLHTADPTAGGSQTSSEAAYTSYGRVAVARTTGGWSISGETISNVGAINFPACTGGSETETYFGVGTALSGAGTLLYAGPLTSGLAVSNGITPSFAAGQLTVTEG